LPKIKILFKKKETLITLIIFFSLFFINLSNYVPYFLTGAISQEVYDAYMFLNENTDEDSTVLLLYINSFEQNHWLLKRLHYLTSKVLMAEIINGNKTFNQSFIFSLPDMGTPAVFNGLSIQSVNTSINTNHSFCDFDYYIMNSNPLRPSSYMIFNNLFYERMNDDAFIQVYSNDRVLVYKRLGSDCLT
jgi:hypothetical protein